MERSVKYAACFVILILVSAAQAQIPQTMSYQGILTDGSGVNVPDGNYNLTFKLYDVASGPGASLWSEGQLVLVNKGVFNVLLGSTNPLNLPFDKQYWLGISVGLNPELTPRVGLASSAYSMNTKSIASGAAVKSLNGLTDAVILTGAGGATVTASGNTLTITASGGGGTGIQGVQNTNNTLDVTNGTGPTATINVKNQGINTAQLADNAVLSGKIASGQAVKSIAGLTDAVTMVGTGNATVTTTGNQITINATGGSGGLSQVEHNTTLSGLGTGASPLSVATITGSNIADGTIGTDKLSFTPPSRPFTPGVSTAEIADNAVLSAKIPTGQVIKSINTLAPASTLHDDVTLAAGANVTITPSGNTITIAATTGSGGGLTSVTHNSTLTGDGTTAPGHELGVAIPLTLSGSDPISILTAINSGTGAGLWGESSGGGRGVYGKTMASGGSGITGYNDATHATASLATNTYGVWATSSVANVGGVGVYGDNQHATATGYGVQGVIMTATAGAYSAGVYGLNNSTTGNGIGVYGKQLGTGWGVYGESNGVGVKGNSTSGVGVLGTSSSGDGVDATSTSGNGIYGTSGSASRSGVVGVNLNSGTGVWGESLGAGNGVYAKSATGNALEVAGPIKVSGSNKAAFIWTTAAGNISSNHTNINYPGMSATDILIVTHNLVSSYLGGHSVGVWWDGSAWEIYIEAVPTVNMPAGEMFNVLVIKQ